MKVLYLSSNNIKENYVQTTFLRPHFSQHLSSIAAHALHGFEFMISEADNFDALGLVLSNVFNVHLFIYNGLHRFF